MRGENMNELLYYANLAPFKDILAKSEVRLAKSTLEINEFLIALDFVKNKQSIFVVLPTLSDAQTYYDDLIKYLEHGALRMNLQYDKANEIIKLDEKNYNNECIEFIEYYYVMKIKQSKLELSDFILRMSPFLTFILFYFLRKNVAALNRVLENINGDKKIRVNASPDQNFINYMNRRVKNLQDGDFITFYILISMYDFYAKNNQKLNSIIGKKLLDELRDIEREIRNDVAHKMINIDEEFIKDKVKMSSKDILLKCEKILKSVFPEFDTNYFVYDDINNRIREVLQK